MTFARRSAVLALLVALATTARPGSAQTQPVTVRVGALPTDNSGNVYFALDRGYFKDAGLDVQIDTLASSPAAAAALTSGAIDVAQSNVTSIAAAHLRGFDFKLFAAAAYSGGPSVTNAIMVANDSPVHSAADLNGKTIGVVAVKSAQQVLEMAWLDKHGGDAKSVKFIEVPYAQMGAQLAAHRIDAAGIIEPFLTTAKLQARVLGNVDDGIGPRFIGLGWGATSAWLETHADVAARFAGAVREAGIWANAHHAESAEILVKYAKLDPATVAHTARATYATELDPALVQPLIDASAKYGALDRTFPATDILWSNR
jgi:NitT/TauT family transport system substrate-binding protein